MNKQDLKDYAQTIYDEYLQKTEDRGISWGEIAYVQGLKKKELDALIAEIEAEMGEQ